MSRPSSFDGCPEQSGPTVQPRMKHTTSNSPFQAFPVAPKADQWSAPEHAIAHVLAHVRTTTKGSASLGGSVHLN